MSEIAFSNVINISLSMTPQGLTKYKTNNVALFVSRADYSSMEPYIVAVTPADYKDVLPSNSAGALMANAFFTPSQNIRTGEGSLFIFPYSYSSAKQATVTTPSVTNTTLQALQTVSNATLTIGIDGVDYTKSGLDFRKVKTTPDVAKVLASAGFDCDISAQEGKVEFMSRLYGADSAIVLKATTGVSASNDLYTILDCENATSEAGTNATGTTLADAVAEAEQQAFFGGVLTTQMCENSLVVANSTAIQAKDHIYYEVTRSLHNIATLGNLIKSAGNSKTRILGYSNTTRHFGVFEAKAALATYATIASSTNYTGTDTCLTMNLKTLTGILPDLNLNQTYINTAKTNGVDIYGSLEGLGIVLSNNNNGYTDDITGQLWLKKDLEVTGFNYLRKTNTKIPQTEAGMTGLKNAYETSLSQGVRNGFIGTGIGWGDDVPVPFGNPEDFRRNILEKGYYIYSIPISQQSQADREERKAPLIQIAVKTAGAIHSSNVIVNIAA